MGKTDDGCKKVVEAAVACGGETEDGAHYFEELHITAAHNFHFAKVIKGGKAVIMLITKKTTNIGMGWVNVKQAVPELEPLVP